MFPERRGELGIDLVTSTPETVRVGFPRRALVCRVDAASPGLDHVVLDVRISIERHKSPALGFRQRALPEVSKQVLFLSLPVVAELLPENSPEGALPTYDFHKTIVLVSAQDTRPSLAPVFTNVP